MRKLVLSLLSLTIAAAVACGGGSSSSTAGPPPAEAGADTGSAPKPDVDGSRPDGGNEEASIPPEPTKPANGTVRGHTFTFAHGIAYPKTVGGGTQGYEIFLSDKPIDCATATIESATTIDVGVAGQPPTARSYAVIEAFAGSAGPNEAESDFNVLDATCGSVVSDASLSGTLVITRFDATKVEGSIDITYETSGRVKEGSVAGTFEAIVCPKFPALTCTPH